MFFRFIFYCILAYVALRFVRRLLSPRSQRLSRNRSREPGPAQMIRCQNCGMFITQNSALLIGGRDYCSRICAERVKRA